MDNINIENRKRTHGIIDNLKYASMLQLHILHSIYIADIIQELFERRQLHH